jgi:hypothetical protein
MTDRLDSPTARLGSLAEQVDAAQPFSGYADTHEPLRAYALLAAAFNGGLAAGLASAQRRGRLPERLDAGDVVLLGVATHKIARLLAKDSVTSFARAPFVHLEEKTGTNSLREQPRGTGMRRAIGELISCPECVGHWVAGCLVVSSLHAPRVTRVVASLYAALAIGDMLQFVYVGLKSRA